MGMGRIGDGRRGHPPASCRSGPQLRQAKEGSWGQSALPPLQRWYIFSSDLQDSKKKNRWLTCKRKRVGNTVGSQQTQNIQQLFDKGSVKRKKPIQLKPLALCIMKPRYVESTRQLVYTPSRDLDKALLAASAMSSGVAQLCWWSASYEWVLEPNKSSSGRGSSV